MNVLPSDGFPHVNGVKVVSNCVLTVNGSAWPFADKYVREIEAHWQETKIANPSYFNGIVHLVNKLRLAGGELRASLVRTEFKNYLYWRTLGFLDTSVIDAFGAALIRSSDGQFLLVRQRPGQVNSGFVYLPSGFIDERDVGPDGTIDIGRSVAREIGEEIGAAGDDLQREEGFIVIRSDAQLGLAVPYYAPMTAETFVARVADHTAQSDDPELEAVIPVGSVDDLKDLTMLPYARALLEALFVAR